MNSTAAGISLGVSENNFGNRTPDYARGAILSGGRGLTGGGLSVSASVEQCVDAIARYREMRGQSAGTARLDAWILRAVGVSPQEATLLDVERVILRTKNRGSRATYCSRIKSTFAALRAMGLITNTVDEELPNLRHPERDPRPLADAKVERILATLRQPHLDVFRVALLTGARASELCALQGQDLVDRAHGPELLLHGKGARDVWIPAHPRVVDIIESYGTLGRLWPQWSTGQALSRSMNRALSSAVGERVTLHQARHTFGTRVMVSSGYDLLLTSQLMRHKDLKTTRGYVKVADSRPRSVIELLAG